jgi:hypothetical protein
MLLSLDSLGLVNSGQWVFICVCFEMIHMCYLSALLVVQYLIQALIHCVGL